MTEAPNKDPSIHAPLAAFNGQKPPAPPWFEHALQRAPERSWTEVEGARIETLTWGQIGRPGLLLLHGNRAHADWWSFIAPFFADHYRVAAMSWSGMGGSDWRRRYTIDLMSQEVGAVAEVTGLFESRVKPVLVAHSLGAFPSLRHAARHGSRLGGLVIVDAPILSPAMHEARRKQSLEGGIGLRSSQVYADLPAALARFRLVPPQACDNLFIVDHIARISLKSVEREDAPGTLGWSWRFDPFQWRDSRLENPAPDFLALTCPLAVMWGGDSVLFNADVQAYVSSLTPAGSPRIEIPAARHHVMVDQPLAFVAALRGLFSTWPAAARTPGR